MTQRSIAGVIPIALRGGDEVLWRHDLAFLVQHAEQHLVVRPRDRLLRGRNVIRYRPKRDSASALLNPRPSASPAAGAQLDVVGLEDVDAIATHLLRRGTELSAAESSAAASSPRR